MKLGSCIGTGFLEGSGSDFAMGSGYWSVMGVVDGRLGSGSDVGLAVPSSMGQTKKNTTQTLLFTTQLGIGRRSQE